MTNSVEMATSPKGTVAAALWNDIQSLLILLTLLLVLSISEALVR
jgi:hypothetical protein